jgi:hypothetical protein
MLGGQSEVADDPAHDDEVGELCDPAAGVAAMRAVQRVDGEDPVFDAAPGAANEPIRSIVHRNSLRHL